MISSKPYWANWSSCGTGEKFANVIDNTEIEFNEKGEANLKIFCGEAVHKKFVEVFNDPAQRKLINEAVERAKQRWAEKRERILRSFGKGT